MYCIPVTASEIARAEKLLGIETKALQATPQRQLDIDEALRQALLVGLDCLERKRATSPNNAKVLVFR